MEAGSSGAALWAYGAASGAYALFAMYLLFGWKRGVAGGLLVLAVACSALWAASNAVSVAVAANWVAQLGEVLDVARQACWLGFLLVLLRPAGGRRLRWPLVAAAAAIAVELAAIVAAGLGFEHEADGSALRLAPFLGGAVVGLVLIEHLIRSLPAESRWAMKPFCLGLAAGYVFEIYLFADGLLFGRLDVDVWGVRGAAHALTIPLIALSAGRNPAWTLNISVSREVVFHSTALALSGVYLLIIAGAGYYVRFFGGEWGRALQLGLIFGGVLLLVMFLFSGAQRARLRVLLNKHLFPYRYDYRAEWLRFTQALGSADGALDLGQSVIKALADLVESSGGGLWLRGANGEYRQSARLNQPSNAAEEVADGALCRFLDEKEWVINLEEFRARPAHYQGLQLPTWLSALADAWLVLPMKAEGALVGFAVLNTPRTPIEVDWEVLDLLKTAQWQAASYLSRMQATEALLESRKFDSFNRMSAFVVHDLKNLVAQLSLMLRNAQRHGGNPEFQADMLATVAHVEGRMRALMAQLQEKKSIDPPRRVELNEILRSVEASRRIGRGGRELRVLGKAPVEVMAHPERLERVLGHLVQNALDATAGGGEVSLRVEPETAGAVRIVVEDNGCGMTQEFIRERLFRPFQTSKPSGMGIGVYEAQQYVRELGGEIVFRSEPGGGTQVTVTLPVARRSAEGGDVARLTHAS